MPEPWFLGEVLACRHAIPSTDNNHRLPTTGCLQDREIRRRLKRYIARQLYRALTVAMTPNIAASA
jgi:hypothetical protein